MRPIVGVILSSVVLVVAVAASRAQAQSSDTSAIAEQLFNQARDLAKANRWAEACPRFEASLRADPVLGTRLNLATCYEHLGKLASAWGIYRERPSSPGERATPSDASMRRSKRTRSSRGCPGSRSPRRSSRRPG
jgi:Tfp pilus assembly protein PilF